jgi:hypothetical protein
LELVGAFNFRLIFHLIMNPSAEIKGLLTTAVIIDQGATLGYPLVARPIMAGTTPI